MLKEIYEKANVKLLIQSRACCTGLFIDYMYHVCGVPQFLSTGSFLKESSWCGCRDLNPGTRLGKPGSYLARLQPPQSPYCAAI